MAVVHGEIMAAHIQVSNLVLHPSLEGTQKAVGTTRTRVHPDEAATCTGVWCVHHVSRFSPFFTKRDIIPGSYRITLFTKRHLLP